MTKIMKINGTPTLINISEKIADKIFSMTGFNYGIHEENNGGICKISFDSIEDAEKFVNLLNSLLFTKVI